MTDIVERLRKYYHGTNIYEDAQEAADEIERLRVNLVDLRGAAAEIDRLRNEIERLRNQISVMEIDRQPAPDLRRATFKAFDGD